MIDFLLKLNHGNEAFGTSGTTITAEEKIKTCESAELAREIAHYAEVVNERTCKFVLDNMLAAVVQKMSEGKAIVLTLDGKAALRIYPDVHLKANSINEAKALELDPTATEITLENAWSLAQKAGGVVVRAKAEAEQSLTDALRALKPSLNLAEKKDVARVLRKENQGGSTNQGGDNNGGSDPEENVLG